MQGIPASRAPTGALLFLGSSHPFADPLSHMSGEYQQPCALCGIMAQSCFD